MSIPFSGTFRRSGGVVSAIKKQLKQVNLKAARRITVSFDPFGDNVTHTRNFLHFLSSPKIGFTNPECVIKTEVVCDRSDPRVDIFITPAVVENSGIKSVVLNSGNLSCLELFQLLNKHVTTLAPQEQVTNTVQTKSEKKSAVKKRK